MVEQLNQLDLIFGSLSDPTRRDILRRVAKQDMNIGEIAENYRLTFAAVAKHLTVLQKAQLISKRRNGKEQIITIAPEAIAVAGDYLENYRNLWETRLDSLGNYLHSVNQKGEK
jgi:DNA-binding transcriptional ArsR family regulator